MNKGWYPNPNPNPNPSPNPYPYHPPQMLIDCSHCRTPLTLPPGAQSVRCAICYGVTKVAPYSVQTPALPTPSPANHNIEAQGSQFLNPRQQSPAPPNAHGSKKAVIIGVSYTGTKFELKGCLNDAKCMKYLLMKKFQFPESCILLLTEDQTDRLKLPTKHNIKMAMYWLIQGCKAGDSLVFHFSGHGAQQENHDGGELDGFDETILPMDFQTQGMIVDDVINESLVRPLPTGVRLHAVVDACHSGTVLDLPFLCRMNSQGKYVWEDHRPRNGIWKGTNGGDAFCFSGCDDDQSSADTAELSQTTFTGAMTFCFIQAIERGQAKTYRELLHAMQTGVRSANAGPSGDIVTTLIEMLLTGGSLSQSRIQEPQLTAAYQFDIDTPFYL